MYTGLPARWYRFNGDFEYELAAWPRPYQPAGIVRSLNRQLAHTMHLLGSAEDAGRREAADVVLEHDPIADLRAARDAGLEPGRRRYIPWGVTPSTLLEAGVLDPEQRFPAVDVVRGVQHRRFGLELEHTLGLALPGSHLIDAAGALEAAVANADSPFVLKHPFGVAGRERVFGRPGQLAEGARRWCLKALADAGALVFEPWVERVREYGVQWWIPEHGAPSLLGILELLTDPNGAYRGHRFGAIDVPPTLEAVTAGIARAVQAAGYFGPLGIDSFEYRDPSGAVRLRPLVELNARHTMGMCALGLLPLAPAGGVATWTHFDAGKVPAALLAALESTPYDRLTRTGVLRTSPLEVDGRPVARVSILSVDAAPAA